MGTCKFGDCDLFKTCGRRDDPWKDNKCCEVYQRYIQQDHVRQRETPFIYLGNAVYNIPNDKPVFKKSTQSKKALMFQLYFIDHKKVKDVAIHAEVAEITVYKFIQRVKKQFAQ